MRDRDLDNQMRAFMGEYARYQRRTNRKYLDKWKKERWTTSTASSPQPPRPLKQSGQGSAGE